MASQAEVASATPGISCIVHARDAEATLDRALASVAWADELIVVDMASRDRTREIAARYATRVIETPAAPRVDGVRSRFLEEATQRWILVLDADEHLADDAEESVRALVAQAGDAIDAYAIPRFNAIAGQTMRGSGWYPDAQVRLFRKGTVRWTDSIHVGPEILTGRERRKVLRPPGCLHIHHANYEDLTHFLRKQLDYALADRYDDDPERFCFDDYLARAWEELARRREPELDGDLSRALSLAMAWDAVVRGLIHWDRLRPRPALPDAVTLPPVTRLGAGRWGRFARRLGRLVPRRVRPSRGRERGRGR